MNLDNFLISQLDSLKEQVKSKGGIKMTDKLKEAIEVLKNLQAHDRRSIIEVDRKAIDTVVEYCEKQLPCDCVIGFEGDIPITHKLCDNCKSKIWE